MSALLPEVDVPLVSVKKDNYSRITIFFFKKKNLNVYETAD